MIDPHDAWECLDPYLDPIAVESASPALAAGRTLARALPATVDVPAADVSAMDGYALAGSAPRDSGPWPVIGVVWAGAVRSNPAEADGAIGRGPAPGALGTLTLKPGQAARIMTGGLVPAGADRVVPVEQTRSAGAIVVDAGQRGTPEYAESELVVLKVPAVGAHIRRHGEVLRRGAEVLPAGAWLGPGALALLAAHGYRSIPVYQTPTVRLLVTGDEVVAPEATPGTGQLRDTHTDFLVAAARTVGVEVEALGIVGDDEEALEAAIVQGLEADIFLLTGGVSAGQRDLVPAALARQGVETLFHKVAIQPAKPLLAGVRQRGGGTTLVFGLPGNPASAMVAFWLFLRPVLRRLLGAKDHYLRGLRAAVLDAPLPAAKGRDRFLPAVLRTEGGVTYCRPVGPAGSHDIAAYARGSALVHIAAHAPPRAAGEACEVLAFADEREG